MATARTRTPRSELQQETRARLLRAANQVFLRRGFHAASVAEIAEEAGYSTGAVYSNFGGKDDLYLTMLDEQLAGSAEAQADAVYEASTFEEAVRAAARQLHQAGEREPGRTPLTVEFWTYAGAKPELRRRARELHERQVHTIGRLIGELAERHGVELALPPDEIARGGGALSRGLRLERLLEPDGVPRELFEEMFAAYVLGFARPAAVTEERGGPADEPDRHSRST